MKKFSKVILQVFLSLGAALTLCMGRAMALTIQEGAEAARADGMPADLIGANGVINQFTNVVLYVVGFVAVVMLIWGGIRYILSGGDSKKITDAKNTILYALLGLVIAFFAFAIVNFVLGAIGAKTLPEDSEDSSEETSLVLPADLA